MHFYKSALLRSALFWGALFEEHHSAFNFVCPHFEKNIEAVDNNDAGKNNENVENDETDDVDENAIDSQNVALQIVPPEIVHFLESALN